MNSSVTVVDVTVAVTSRARAELIVPGSERDGPPSAFPIRHGRHIPAATSLA